MEGQMKTTTRMFRGKEVPVRYHTFAVFGWWIQHGSSHRRHFKTGDSLPELVNPRQIHMERWDGEVDLRARENVLSIIRDSANLKKVYLFFILTPEEGEELSEFAHGRIDLQTTSHRNETNYRHEAFRTIRKGWKVLAARGDLKAQSWLRDRRKRDRRTQ